MWCIKILFLVPKFSHCYSRNLKFGFGQISLMKFDIFFSFMLPYIIIDSRNINRSVLTFFMIEYPCLTSVNHFKFFLVVPPGNTLELYEVRISFVKVFSLFMGMIIP